MRLLLALSLLLPASAQAEVIIYGAPQQTALVLGFEGSRRASMQTKAIKLVSCGFSRIVNIKDSMLW
ncbi:MAG: hypothetical protein DME05_02590 [Candidatus Rokuibacteriota bacterium]|nr:MAG: hypothetical protein DME05_02590 [Candidatus Rokubacteria bacterium]PYN79074.1 MAG: hypothetical protein DMD97_05405 [Candidatus Rokubacteria bacterium]